MPFVVGMKKDDALQMRDRLRAAGIVVEFKRGPMAPSTDRIYSIESQQPEANTPLKPGDKVLLRWYDRMQTANSKQ